MSNAKNLHELALSFSNLLKDVRKTVNIQIASDDFMNLKQARYILCFAKKVGDNDYNVVWQSYLDYLLYNNFSWTPQYALFGSTTFQDNYQVRIATNTVNIGLGETSTLSADGVLGSSEPGGPTTGFTMDNQYGSIHPGVNQLSTGITGEVISTPIYVTEAPMVKGSIVLTPVEKVLVWFEENIETSTMFSTPRSMEVEIDLTFQNTASRKFENQQWKTI